MTTPDTLLALAARVEAASGADRELDAEIVKALYPDAVIGPAPVERVPDALADGLLEMLVKATAGPWAWEQCGDKHDAPVAGIAYPSDDTDSKRPYAGEFRDDDAYRETIAADWHECDGRPAHANVDLAVAAVNALPQLLTDRAADRARVVELEKERDKALAWAKEQHRCADDYADDLTTLRATLAASEARRERVEGERDAMRDALGSIDTDVVAAAIHDARWIGGCKSSTWTDFHQENEAGRIYCAQLANAAILSIRAALAPETDK